MGKSLALLVIALILGACGPEQETTAAAELTLDDIRGFWHLESFEVDGVMYGIEPRVNTSRVPWLEITETITGNAGCNGFGSGEERPSLEGGVLSPGEVISEMVLCMSEDPEADIMEAEETFVGVLWDENPIAVSLDGNVMTWSSATTVLTFARSDGPPPTTTLPPPILHSIGRLVCGDGVVVEERIPDTGPGPLDIAKEAAPDVVDVEPGDPLWWWGVNQNGAVFVAIALGDMDGADYQVWTCDPPLDSSTSADLLLPDVCYELYETGTPELPPDTEIVAQLPFRDGLLVVYGGEQSGARVFSVIECFTPGGSGGGGGGPGETWQGCYRVEWSDLGYAMAFLESPDWAITIAGTPVDVVATSDGRGVALLEETFDRTPDVVIIDDAGAPCE